MMGFEKKLSLRAREKFAKDYSVPFKLLGDGYFDYFAGLVDRDYNLSDKLISLCMVIEDLGGEDQFFKYSSEFPFRVIDDIKQKDSYANFIGGTIESYPRNVQTSKKGIYKSCNANKNYISIDLSSANYHSMKSFDEDLVNNSKDYDDFIRKYTPYDYFINSKKIRQVIFGNLNPKRQQQLQRNVISQIIDLLVNVLKLDKETLVASTSDELIIDVTDYGFDVQDLMFEIFSSIKLNIKDFPVKVEHFKLGHIGNNCFVKRKYGSSFLYGVEFKNVSGVFFPQAYKKYYCLPLNDKDMTFIHEKCEAKFVKPYFEGVTYGD